MKKLIPLLLCLTLLLVLVACKNDTGTDTTNGSSEITSSKIPSETTNQPEDTTNNSSETTSSKVPSETTAQPEDTTQAPINYCKHDDATKIEVVPAVEPTCINTGLTQGMKCTLCNTMVVPQAIRPITDCVTGDWIIDKEATKTEDGAKHQICSVCKVTLSEETIPATGSLGLAYTINDNGATCTITGIGTCTDTEIFISKYVDGYKVTAIAQNAFSECAIITDIHIPNTVTSIGTRAFYGCTGLTSITIPESVKNIGTQIFYKASNLTTVYYNSQYSSSDNPFLNLSHITKVVFGGKIVPSFILRSCTNIKEIEIKNSVTIINRYAFSGCTSLTSITIPDSVTSIDGYAFEGCKITSITIGNGVKSIDFAAFEGCTNLTSITIPDSVTSIDSSVFAGCTNLTSITIPDSVTSIGSSVFDDCTSLISIIIGKRVTSIGRSAFSDCTNLRSITIGNSVTNIDDYAFSGCTNLTSITIPDSVTSIEDYVFKNCTSLKNITIPDSVAIIGEQTFNNCSSLTSIHFGGTKAQWNVISKDSPWDSSTGRYTVYCSDGTITK